jgi:hypothetical protein
VARGLGYAARVRRDILKKRDQVQAGRGKVKDAPRPKRNPKKTALMLLIEAEHGRPIEELITEGEIAEIGRDLGIDASTVSKWRLRFGIR